jgi:radical SAM superfamily enzyme YgiQ (UPF0313 family)
MKILFINPSIRPKSEMFYLPVGLGYVMTYVREKGYKFDLLDIDAARYSNEYVESFLQKNKYDIICLGSLVTHYKWVKWCISVIKNYNPDTKVIVGNSVGGSIPEVLFQTTKVDIVIYGEAEITITEVFDALKQNKKLGEIVEPHVQIPNPNKGYPATIKGDGIPGIIYRTKNNLIVNNGKRKAVKNIDDFPFPDWDLFDVERYLKVNSKMGASHSWFYKPEDAVILPINTARGCIFKCSFCHYVFWHDPYRHRSTSNIIAEIKQNQRKYKANFFNFWDELSFHKIGPTSDFLDEFIKEDLKIHWTCAIRADLMGKEEDAKGNFVPRETRLDLAKRFVTAGCVSAGYSLESGNDKILESMNKRVKSKYFKEQVKICREAGLITNTSLVIGYPEETLETINETMSQLEDLKVYPSAGFLLPLPETGMWNYAIENGHIKDIDVYLSNIADRQDFSLNLTKMNEEEMKKHVLDWLARLNEKFGNNLKKENLLKTGGYDKHAKNQNKLLDKNMTTTDSLNYATQEGTLR